MTLYLDVNVIPSSNFFSMIVRELHVWCTIYDNVWCNLWYKSQSTKFGSCYDEIMMKPVMYFGAQNSNLHIAYKKIMDYQWCMYMAVFSVRFLWWARTRGNSQFSLPYGTWRSRPGQLARSAHPNIRVYGACCLLRCPSSNYGGVQ